LFKERDRRDSKKMKINKRREREVRIVVEGRGKRRKEGVAEGRSRRRIGEDRKVKGKKARIL